MIFNLKDDPWEMKDRSGDPEGKAALERLLAFRQQYEAERQPCAQYRELVER